MQSITMSLSTVVGWYVGSHIAHNAFIDSQVQPNT